MKLFRYRITTIQKLLLYVTAFLLAIAVALRIFGLDRDYWDYRIFFESIGSGAYNRFEPGFVLFSTAFSEFVSKDFSRFLFALASVSLFLKFKLINNYRYKWLWVAVYSLILLPLHEMTQIRLALAAAFGYWAVYLAINNEGKGRLVPLPLLLMGASFQVSVLILLPFVAFTRLFKRPLNLFFISGLVSLPAVLLWSSINVLNSINPTIAGMLESVGETQKANPLSIRNVVFLTILVIGLINIKRLSQRYLPWLYLSLMGMSLWFGMMKFPVFAHRLLELTLMSYFFWIPELPKTMRFICIGLLLILSIYLCSKMLYFEPLFTRE